MNCTERRREITKAIFEAMGKAEGVDWAATSPAITQTGTDLDEAIAQYMDGQASRADVKNAYKRFRDAHTSGGLFT